MVPNSFVFQEEELDQVLSDFIECYGYDFTGYARASLKRRIQRVFNLDKQVSFAEFRYKVRTDPHYFKFILEQVTVNVTEMFRDPKFYEALRKEIIPQLSTYPFIRIWLAGCSTGEEAYSIAILLKELNLLHKSLLYATDINPRVIEKASAGIFSVAQMKQNSENYIASGGKKDFSTYYTANYDFAKFHDELRQNMIFSTHNLVSDHSFNEFQLILCRNVLIYFDRQLQNNVLDLFDNSLEKLGYLALGSKESIDFSTISKKYKRITSEKIWRKLDETM
ncbi:MAG: protein-glutamate O-methyltransferase CheR [Pedobacter sp.]|nr:MAG: protein-glutamate O-methyltransferase CheR [Pedobacter sp.]